MSVFLLFHSSTEKFSRAPTLDLVGGVCMVWRVSAAVAPKCCDCHPTDRPKHLGARPRVSHAGRPTHRSVASTARGAPLCRSTRVCFFATQGKCWVRVDPHPLHAFGWPSGGKRVGVGARVRAEVSVSLSVCRSVGVRRSTAEFPKGRGENPVLRAGVWRRRELAASQFSHIHECLFRHQDASRRVGLCGLGRTDGRLGGCRQFQATKRKKSRKEAEVEVEVELLHSLSFLVLLGVEKKGNSKSKHLYGRCRLKSLLPLPSPSPSPSTDPPPSSVLWPLVLVVNTLLRPASPRASCHSIGVEPSSPSALRPRPATRC